MKTLIAPTVKIFIFILWFSICGIVFSNAGRDILHVTAVIYIVGGALVFWVLKTILLYKKLKADAVTKRVFYPWFLGILIFLFPIALAYFGTFAYIRFSLSESALMDYVKGVKAGNVDLNFEFTHPDRVIGLYRISYTDLLDDGTVRVITSSDGLLDAAGFAFSYQIPPPEQGEGSYKPIKRNWWYWRRSW